MEYSFFELFNFYKKFFVGYRLRIYAASLIRAISAVLYLYSAYAVSQIVTLLIKIHEPGTLIDIFLILITWGLISQIRYLCIYWSKMLFFNVSEKVGLAIQNNAVEYISKIDIAWHERENTGNKTKRISRGASAIRTAGRVWIINLIDIFIGFFGIIFIISRFDRLLSFFVILYLCIYFFMSTYFKKKYVAANQAKNIIEEQYNGIIHEIVANIRSLKVLDMRKGLLRETYALTKVLLEKIHTGLKWYHFQILARVTAENIGRLSLYAFVVYGIFDGHYELGFFVLFSNYMGNITSSITDLTNITQDLAIARNDANRLLEFFKTPITIDNEKDKVSFPADWKSIHVKDISFTYGNQNALSGINLSIKRGEKIGIVGLSGAGKSTLFKILLKEYEATTGDVYIDSTPLKSIKKSDYLKHTTAVLQETEVFNMTLKKNIIISNLSAEHSEDTFKRSIETSHVQDFLHKLPQGVDTVIGEKGVKLSGGERQRVGIARAIFKDPQILLLDEATSHLDVESEQKIQDSLHQFFKGITAIVIAHRLSTIKEMDRIIVIENGTIIEQGTFNELHAKDARFREFWDKQSQV